MRPDDYDIKKRPDRVSKYFEKYAEDFVFDEFSDAYINKTGFHCMKGVPVPLRKQDAGKFHGGNELPMNVIAKNITLIMGINTKFKYIENYLEFMENFNKKNIVNALVKEGRAAASSQDNDKAAIHFRAALCILPDNIKAMYSYALICRELYLAGGDEEYVGRFKAEANEFFEFLVALYPRFSKGYYYLGYAYLNLGLYIKAKLTWDHFMDITANPDDRLEIENRLNQLEQPVRIEEGCNAFLSGRYEHAISILKPFVNTRFKDWWPMSYYLGVAYERTGDKKKAVDAFKRVLALNPSHVESMDELANIYEESKDADNENKYRNKADLIRSGGYEFKGGK